ncbi:unnamed protein product [Heterobilharzia americana]|nr:unnamed protein product [Heterobilharzia americana]
MKLSISVLYLYFIGFLFKHSESYSFLSVFWVSLVLNSNLDQRVEVILNKTVWELKLLKVLQGSSINYSADKTLSLSENSSVVVDRIDFDRSNLYLKLFFYVWRNNIFQPSPAIVRELNRVPENWLAVSLGMPIVEKPKVYDLDAYEKVDDYIWVIGIVTSCFLGLLFICWFFIFVYTYILQATAMDKWLPKPYIRDSKPTLYKQEKVQKGFQRKEFMNKTDSQIQTDFPESYEFKINHLAKSTTNGMLSNISMVDSSLPDRLSPVIETNLEEPLTASVNEVKPSSISLPEAQDLLTNDHIDDILIDKPNEVKRDAKERKKELTTGSKDEILQANESDKTLAFGSFNNVKPLIMSTQPRQEALRLANILNTQQASIENLR